MRYSETSQQHWCQAAAPLLQVNGTQGRGPAAASPAAATQVGWGAAVHGSSAFLQATCMKSQLTCCASEQGPQPLGARSGQPLHHQTFSQPQPDGFETLGASTSQHQHWHPSDGAPGLTACQAHAPQHATSRQPPEHPHQHPASNPHQQQYAWQSYHAHSVMMGPDSAGPIGAAAAAATATPAASDGWYGWSSHYYARPPQPYPHAGHPFSPQPQLQPHSQQPGCQGGGDEDAHVTELANGPGGVAVQAPTGTGTGIDDDDDAYDPVADVDLPNRAAACHRGCSDPSPASPATEAAAAGIDRCRGQEAAPNSTAGASAAPPSAQVAPRAASGQPPPPLAAAFSQSVDLVVVWDLDETLIIFNSLLSGAFARAACGSTARAAAGAADTAAAAASAACKGAVASAAGAEWDPSLCARPLADRAVALGQQLADLVFSFCDDHLSFRQLDNTDPQSFLELLALTSAAGDDTATKAATATAAGNAAAAARASSSAVAVHRSSLERIAEVYGRGSEGLLDVIGEPGCRTLAVTMANAEHLTGGWVAAARRLLAGVSAAVSDEGTRASIAAVAATEDVSAAGTPSCAPAAAAVAGLTFRRVRHVLVSSGHLVATLGKLLLWGLDSHFDIRDVYSASGRPKLEVFRHLRARYGPNSAFAAVGDGLEEERAAALLGWGFVRVALTETPAMAAGEAAAEAADVGVAVAAVGARVGEGSGAPSVLAVAGSQQVARAAARPLGAIQPEDVLTAARLAYYD